jgi:hypothetical protein
MNPAINATTTAANAKIKADINANPTLLSLAGAGDYDAIAAHYNAETSAYYVWKSSVPASLIRSRILWPRLTPAGRDNTTAWTNRAIDCQGKQFNVEIMIGAESNVPTGLVNYRTGFRDALESVPSLANGSAQDAGWAQLEPELKRLATRIEQVLATGTGTFASPADLGGEGRITPAELSIAWTY